MPGDRDGCGLDRACGNCGRGVISVRGREPTLRDFFTLGCLPQPGREGWGTRHVVAIDLVDDADAPLWFNPVVLFGEAGIGANGGDDAVGRRRHVGRILEKMVEDGTKIFRAAGVESGGAGVSIDGGPVEDMTNGEFAANGLRAVPVDEKFLDGFAIGMIANLALAAVALEIRSVGSDGASFDAGFPGAQSGFRMGGDCGGHCVFLL